MNAMKKLLLVIPMFFAVLPQAGAEPVRLGVAEFVSRTSMADKEMLQYVTEIFTKILSSSRNIEVTESSSLGTLKAVNAQGAAEAGKNADCQYVVLGAIMDETSTVDYSNHLWKPSVELESVLETRVIEVATGRMILSASGRGQVKYTFTPRVSMTMKGANAEMERLQTLTRDNQNKSLTLASSMAAEKICASLTGDYPKISSVTKFKAGKNAKKSSGSKSRSAQNILGTVRINRGTSAGIQEGTLYSIYFDGGDVSDLNGESLGREKCTVAIAEVREVRENFCTAEITAGILHNIREGDKAEQISEEEARSIIDSNSFTRTRMVVDF